MTKSLDELAKLKEVIGIGIGEASVCWSEIPKGTFESTKALAIVDKIVAACQVEMAKREVVLVEALNVIRHHVVGHKGNGEILAEIDQALAQIGKVGE